jgi:hypothetical protein
VLVPRALSITPAMSASTLLNHKHTQPTSGCIPNLYHLYSALWVLVKVVDYIGNRMPFGRQPQLHGPVIYIVHHLNTGLRVSP